MKRMLLLLVVALACAAAYLPALPKVAVLDAVIPEDMDKSVVVPITDKIAEEIVNSHQYSVLDRANVEQVLREKEFQVSGMVQDSDIKQAGKYLGADFVVVARVSLVAGTYFISAKMINVETGAVTAQVSDDEEGKASVLIKIAERVGKKLVGGIVQSSAEAQTKTETGRAEGTAAATEKPRPLSTVTVEIGLPIFAGAFPDAASEWVDIGAPGDTITDLGVGGRASFFLLPFLYAGGSVEFAQKMRTDSYDGTVYTVFSGTGLMANAGYGRALRPGLQIYAGGKLGLIMLLLGDSWTYRDGEAAAGLAFGLEAGAELILLKLITLSVRLDWVTMSFADGSSDIDSTFFDFSGVSSSSYDSPYSYNRIGLNIGAGIALGGRKK